MLGVIPNPKKTFQIEKNVEDIKLAVEHIPLFTDTYKIFKSNPVMNLFTFEATEFLSLGVYIDITYFTINENRTEVNIEIRRKIGTFNQSHEVTQANTHLGKISDLLSESLSMNIADRLELIKQNENKKLNIIVEQKRKLETAKKKAELEKLNNPLLYYSKQVLYIVLAIGMIVGIAYAGFKILR